MLFVVGILTSILGSSSPETRRGEVMIDQNRQRWQLADFSSWLSLNLRFGLA